MMKLFCLLLILLPFSAWTNSLDDFEDNQATLEDQPGTPEFFTAWQTLNVDDGLAGFRRIYVDGGGMGEPSNFTSAGVSGGSMTVAFGHEEGLFGQLVIVAWSDRDSSTIWEGSLDLSNYDALVLDMGLVTQPINVVLNLREKGSAISQDEPIVIDAFGTHVFDLSIFDQIDLSQIDAINIRISPAQSADADGFGLFNDIYFFTDEDLIFATDFE